MNSQAKTKFYQIAVKYVDGLKVLDRGSYASQCMYAMIDGQPLPDNKNYRLTRTGTFAAETKEGFAIRRRIQEFVNQACSK